MLRRLLPSALRIAGLVALLGLLAVSLVGGQHPLDQGTPAPLVTGRTLDGAAFDLTGFRDQPVIVNIWATWCPPCVQEIPLFVRAAEKYRGQVAFVGLAADGDVRGVGQMVQRFSMSYPVALIDGATSRRWNATALPSTYAIDRDGRVVFSLRGGIDAATLDDLVARAQGSR